MSAALDRIRAAGVEVTASDGRLFARGELTETQRAYLREHRAELVAELAGDSGPRICGEAGPFRQQREARLKAVQDRLAATPELLYAWETHDEIDPTHIIVTVALREAGACELSIKRDKFDPFKMLEILGSPH